jgi:DNA-binding response OmpR family regulator
MLYMIEEDAVRAVFFPAVAGEQQVGPARDGDLPAMEALAPGFELLRDWWEAVPEAFVVARAGREGAVAGFAILAEPHTIPPRLLDRDRLAGAWRAHLRRDAPPRGQRVLFLRHLIAPIASAPQAALLLEATRRYFELRPELRRVYAPSSDFIGADPSCAMVLGYLPIDGDPDSVCMDFGPASVDGWLAELGARQQLAADVRPAIAGLTKLEAEVLAYLGRHEGRAVERAALLRDVWGYDWTGGSNVVEVVVSSLRRKLGERAGALETVRGVGYKLGPL